MDEPADKRLGEYLGKLPPGVVDALITVHDAAAAIQKDQTQKLGVTNYFINITVMNDNSGSRSITTGGGAFTANAPVTLGDRNKITSTTTVGEVTPVGSALDELSKLIDQLKTHLPPKAAARASDDLDTLKKEAASDEPRKPWYELSANGLKDAAKSVASIGPDVVKAVDTVLKLLTPAG